MKKEKLLNIIISHRTEKALDKIISINKEYQDALKEQDEAFIKLDQINAGSKERKVINRAIDANNALGTAYGKNAYKLGLQDGLKLALELRAMCRC